MAQFYTVAEANALLPELTSLLENMRSHGEQLASLQGKQVGTLKKMRGNGHHDPSEDAMMGRLVQDLEEGLRKGIAQLAEWGIQLKDLATGLVDFPALREERTVFLCWQLGEPEVAFWHETTTGFGGRQPLDNTMQ